MSNFTSSLAMLDWLRTRSPALRYSVYVAGAVLMFLVAVGMGSAVAVVVGWQSGRASIGHGTGHGAATSEGSVSETTGSDITSEDTAIEPSTEFTISEMTADKASFVHRARDRNSRGDYTYISDPSIDGHPNAIVFASPTSGRRDAGGAPYEHNIGVWYASRTQRWAIFNQDRAAVPAGSRFEVVVPQASTKFVHQADLLNTAGNYTYLDNRLTNGKPDAVLSVTQNWNPGGGGGVYNDHPVGVLYDTQLDKWAVYNRDGKPLPEGASFNIAVSTKTPEGAR